MTFVATLLIGCVGLSLVRISEAILHDENAVLPVSTLINDYLGSRDVYLSMPAVVNRRGVREILRIGLNAKEERAFKHSFTEIQTIIHAAGL
jgi:L-lactate dehydrogenase